MDTEGADRCMVDTNVLVYATVDAAPLCDEARMWMARLQRRDVQLCVTPQICREYLVVLTGDPVFDREFSSSEALDVLSAVRSSLEVLVPSTGVLKKLFALIRRYDVAGKRIHDANVVALMLTEDLFHLATYNRQDFTQFEKITLLPPPDRGEGQEEGR